MSVVVLCRAMLCSGNAAMCVCVVQVTTVLPGVALLYLTYNLVKPWVIRWVAVLWLMGDGG